LWSLNKSDREHNSLCVVRDKRILCSVSKVVYIVLEIDSSYKSSSLQLIYCWNSPPCILTQRPILEASTDHRPKFGVSEFRMTDSRSFGRLTIQTLVEADLHGQNKKRKASSLNYKSKNKDRNQI